ncbi:MAG: hypothetical protein C0595_12715 [Marinilabiliales bacterium]|nr:MAG: hypothetical protein C0595_12715 [Marinilabiliales bacterium]
MLFLKLFFNEIIMAEKGNETENLSRIKEILFGEDLSSIEERFDNFKNENIAAFQEIKSDFEKKMVEFEKLLSQKQKQTETTVKETQEIQETFKDTVEKNISNVNLEIVKEKTKIQETIQKIEDKNTEKLENLISDINKSIAELRDLLNSKFEEINDKKIDSKDLADLFQSIADKLKS